MLLNGAIHDRRSLFNLLTISIVKEQAVYVYTYIHLFYFMYFVFILASNVIKSNALMRLQQQVILYKIFL